MRQKMRNCDRAINCYIDIMIEKRASDQETS